MSWLKRFGQIMTKVAGVSASLAGFEPLARVLLPRAVVESTVYKKADSIFEDIAGAIVTAEVMVAAINAPDAKTGPDKLKAAAPLVAQLVSASSLLAGREIKDQAKYDAAILQITGGVADLLNSY